MVDTAHDVLHHAVRLELDINRWHCLGPVDRPLAFAWSAWGSCRERGSAGMMGNLRSDGLGFPCQRGYLHPSGAAQVSGVVLWWLQIAIRPWWN